MAQENTPRTFAQAMQEIEKEFRFQLQEMPQADAPKIIRDSQLKRLKMTLEICNLLLDTIIPENEVQS